MIRELLWGWVVIATAMGCGGTESTAEKMAAVDGGASGAPATKAGSRRPEADAAAVAEQTESAAGAF